MGELTAWQTAFLLSSMFDAKIDPNSINPYRIPPKPKKVTEESNKRGWAILRAAVLGQ